MGADNIDEQSDSDSVEIAAAVRRLQEPIEETTETMAALTERMTALNECTNDFVEARERVSGSRRGGPPGS